MSESSSSKSLLDAVRFGVLIGDGAMGTELQRAGLPPGGCGEAWNADEPEKVLAIQKAYVDAGSNCLTTNTFGGSRIMLERHHEEGRVRELNVAAVEIARRAFGESRGYVLGDIGPFGGLMEPYGDVPPERVEQAFGEQARALVEAGADAIIIETQTALEELGIGIEAAKAAGAPCVIGSMAFDKMQASDEVRTMMGTSPEQAAEFMAEKGVDIIGINCGTGVDMAIAADTVRRYRDTCELPVMAQPNAGLPVVENMKVVYKETPEEMAAGVPSLLEAGARIVGGCCGSTPDHIRAIRIMVERQREREREARARA
jgi:5-methyltetrahydrofolate--homocysteine methyltransferase